MNKEREDFMKRIQGNVSKTDDISGDWKQLVGKGIIEKIGESESEYKKSGGYSELSSTEDIEK